MAIDLGIDLGIGLGITFLRFLSNNITGNGMEVHNFHICENFEGKDILDRLYNGELCPNQEVICNDPEYIANSDKIQKDREDNIAANSGNITVLELVKKYTSHKKGVRHNTEANYRFVINIIARESFGSRRIEDVRLSEAREWLIKLQSDGRGYSTIHTVRGVVRPAFQMAVDDELIRKNPFEFQLGTVVVNDSATREALTRKQEREFLEFIRNDSHYSRYYDGIFILFRTGMRISEFTGLVVSDIDFVERKINVDHQLQRKRDMEYIIEDTKTVRGTRQIPMTDEVYDCFRRIVVNRKKPKVEPMVSGKCGFLFLDKNDMPMVALHWEKFFQRICIKYNRINKIQILKVAPHICRHTFCSNMAKSGMNPKTLQYIMGHSDIATTLGTYTHIGYEDASVEMRRVANM